MQIQCECGKFIAEAQAFPKGTPGRLVCYCDDCQAYLHHLGRADLLDRNGGTEIIPAYPCDVKIIKGKEHLKCTRLSNKGMFRFSTTCCNTPVGNTAPRSPWLGLLRRVYTAKDPTKLDAAFPKVRSSIMGKFAKGTPPKGTPQKFDLKGFTLVTPYMLKGVVMKKWKPSPFFENDSVTPVAKVNVLSEEELRAARAAAEV